MPAPQSFKNHGRAVPVYHVGVSFSFVANVFWSVYGSGRSVNGESILDLVVAVALLLLFFSVRGQILTVQDRVIRLEMQLRLARVLPANLQTQISRLAIQQLIALRFASDAELPALVRDVLAGKFDSPKAIKMQVTDWQADVQRA